MIFGKDKKNLNSISEQTNSVEDSALNRWKSINQNSESEENLLDRNSNLKQTSQLSALMKNDIPIQEEEKKDPAKPTALEKNFQTNKPAPFQREFVASKLEHSILNLDKVLEESPTVKIKNETAVTAVTKTPVADFSKNIEDDLANGFGSNLKSALGEGTVIDGMFSFETPVKVDGSLTGDIKSASALIVGKKASIKARVKVGSLIVLGTVEGEIQAEDLVEIRSSGSVSGDIVAKRISLEEGGIFNGSCTIID